MAAIDRNANGSRWFTDEVIQLIDTVKSCECLYNPKHKNYFCRPVVENLWKEIDIKLGKPPGASLSKWTNLRICFRREYTTFLKEKAKPYWAFFDKMFFLHAFLRRKRPTVGRLESHIQEALEKVSSITRGNFKNYVENIENLESYEDEDEDDSGWNNNTIIKKEHYDDENEQDFEVGSFDTDTAVHPAIYEEQIIPSQSTQVVEQANKLFPCKPSINLDQRSIYVSATEQNKLMPSSTTQDESVPRQKTDNDNVENVDQHDLSKNTNTTSKTDCKNDASGNSRTQSVLCKCKVDTDAMFLMSLLPDIQALSRRDKGKFKIETQRLIQNLLYPEDK